MRLGLTGTLLALTILGASSEAQTVIFADDFNRPGPSVGNGWVEVPGSEYVLSNCCDPIQGMLYRTDGGGSDGGHLYRPMALASSLTIRFELLSLIGSPHDGALAGVSVRSAGNSMGTVGGGFGVVIGDVPGQPLFVSVFDEDVVNLDVHTFGGANIPDVIEVTIQDSGNIDVRMLSTCGNGEFNYTFGPHPITAAGDNLAVAIVGSVEPALDNLTVSVPGEPALGTPYCFGTRRVGCGGSCPCQNFGNLFEGCAHSGGEGMLIEASGSTSIGADDLVLTTTQAPPGNTGLFYVGTLATDLGNPFYDGLQCVGGDVRRFNGLFQIDGTAQDTGFVAQAGAGYFQAGATYNFQYLSRDVSLPSPCGTGANLSPGYAVTMTP